MISKAIQVFRSVFFNNSYSVAVTVAMLIFGSMVANHFYQEWLEDRAAVKITDAVINKADAYERIDKKFKKEVKRDLEKVGTDDIFDAIN